MYWHKLDEQDKLMLANHIYLAALRALREDGAREVCRNALLRAGARAGEAEQLPSGRTRRSCRARRIGRRESAPGNDES